jgi:prepilin peptidase CpaA
VLVLLCVALAAAVVSDVMRRRIPNPLVGAIAIGGFVHAFVLGGVRGLLAAVLGSIAGLGLLFWQFRRGWMGAGDVKLLGALGSWVGMIGALSVFVLASLFGGVLGVIAWLRLPRAEQRAVRQNLSGLEVAPALALERPRTLPYGVALAAAGAAVLLLRAFR